MAATCCADWINLSGAENSPDIAEIYVYDDHVKVVLEIYLKDISIFMDLLPDEYFKNAGVTVPSAADRLRDKLADKWDKRGGVARDRFGYGAETSSSMGTALRGSSPKKGTVTCRGRLC